MLLSDVDLRLIIVEPAAPRRLCDAWVLSDAAAEYVDGNWPLLPVKARGC